MAHPLTPYSENRGSILSFGAVNGWGYTGYWKSYMKHVSGTRQRKPYNIFTHYEMNEYKTLFGPAGCDSWSWSPGTTEDVAKANNVARKEFISQLGDTSSFGATATAEGQKTLSTVATVITRLATAAMHVKRLNLFKAAEVLGLPYTEKVAKKSRYRTEYVSRKNGLGRIRVRTRVEYTETRVDWGTGRDHLKSAASGWLLWSYGAKPLIQDIQNGMEVFTRELPATTVSSRGYGNWTRTSNNGSGTTTKLEAETRVKFECQVRVINPNLWLANQLGLTNPLQWINEAIPFSFVLDWVSNLSDVISQISDFSGLEILNPCRITKSVIKEITLQTDGFQLNQGKQWTRFTRDATIPPVTLLFSYERFHVERGLNAISLLLGFLPKK